MSVETGKRLERLFKGLGNRRRLAIIKLLAKEKELSVADVARGIDLSFTSTSKHLLLLHQLDIVDRRQEHLTVYYRLIHPLPQALERIMVIISNSRE